MTEQQILDNLCVYDPRYPGYYSLTLRDLEEDLNNGYSISLPVPRHNCYCDNCFNGRDRLAVELLECIKGVSCETE